MLAEAFHVRIEMKQIGARQEAGRIGGIGPCGRELCCATWMKNFSSVSTAAARFQDITPNPQKLAGQCAKLKCCLNYEVDAYMEAARKLPERHVQLETADSTYYFFKADILAGLVTYSTDRRMAVNLVTLSAERAKEIAALNAAGEKPISLVDEDTETAKRPIDLAEQDDLTRFDKTRKRGNRNGKRGGADKNNATRAERAVKAGNKEQQTDRQPREQRSENRRDRRERRDKGNTRQQPKQAKPRAAAPNQPTSKS